MPRTVLRPRVARHRRAADRAAGHAAPLCLPWLRGCRGDRLRARLPRRQRHGDLGAGGARARQQIRRRPAAILSGADAGAAGYQAGSLDASELGQPRLLVADAALRADTWHRAGLGQSVRQRHGAAGARPRTGPDRDRAAVVLRDGRPSPEGARPPYSQSLDADLESLGFTNAVERRFAPPQAVDGVTRQPDRLAAAVTWYRVYAVG